MSGPVQLGRLKQVALTVEDLGRATAFYGSTLGLGVLVEAPTLSILDCGGTRLMLTLPEGEFERNASILYFQIADLAGAFTALGEQGVEFLGEPHKVADFGGRELWMAFFRDSEGNVMALEEERRAAPAESQ